MILFTANSKVQKDRAIMRETDTRMAKYSRRGLIVNFLAYLLCLSIGYLTVMAPTMAVVLTVGLIVTTLARAGFLFRFESLYNCGPARWRAWFFISTLLGAAWWSIILVSFTLTLGMIGETPILWLYTIIFFSTTIHVTSPFKVFSQIYLALTLVPPILAACFVGGFDGYMYAVMMLVFVGMLYHQIDVLEGSYWERFEAIYSLRQKARNLEAEKMDVDASVDLNSRFLVNLGHEFRTSLNDILGGVSLLTETNLEGPQRDMLKLTQKAAERQLDLVNNIVDFSRINNRKLVLDHAVFNLRSQLEHWIDDLAVDAHQQGVEVDYEMHSAIPLRAHGDANRIGQVFKNLFANAIQFSDQGSIHIDIDFKRECDRTGFLEVLLVDKLSRLAAEEGAVPARKSVANDEVIVVEDPSNAEAGAVTTRTTGLWYSICKGLSECMGGSVDIDSAAGQETHYRLRLPLRAAGQQNITISSHPKLQGCNALLIHTDLEFGSSHQREIREWGVNLQSVTDFESAQELIEGSQGGDTAIQLVLINLHQDWESAQAFALWLLMAPETRNLPLVFLLNHNHLNNTELLKFIKTHSKVHYHYRPVMRQKLHDLMSHAILGKPLIRKKVDKHRATDGGGHEILLVDDHRVNQMVAEGMLKKIGYRVAIASNGLEAVKMFKKGTASVVLMDCQMPEMDGFEATRQIRKLEEEAGGDSHIPIIAMTAHTDDGDQSLCFACGMDDYLAKPVRYDVLESHLLRWLGTEESEQPVSSSGVNA
ncbi:MAG: response regulator [Cellvibrionaceae bacterium]